MSRMKLLLDVVEGMRSLADSIQAAAVAMAGNEPAGQTQPESSHAAEVNPQTMPVTLEQVRAVLAEQSQAGFGAQVRLLLEKHGAAKLSQIEPTNYAALLKDAEKLKFENTL